MERSMRKGRVFLSPSSSYRNYCSSNKNITHLNFFSLCWGSQSHFIWCHMSVNVWLLLPPLQIWLCGSGLIKLECVPPTNVEIVLSFLKTSLHSFHKNILFYISRGLLFFLLSFPCENVYILLLCFMCNFRSPMKYFGCGSPGNCYGYDLRSLFFFNEIFWSSHFSITKTVLKRQLHL